MKNIKYIFVSFLVAVLLTSCDEDKWLEEKAYDFYTPENSYTTTEQIDLAITHLYRNVSNMMYGSGANGDSFLFSYTTDVGYCTISINHELNSWANAITPESRHVGWLWTNYYKQIYDANTVLDRIENIEYISEDKKNAKIAEAKFFRAYAYKCLAVIFGGVPIVLHEVNTVKRDFTRATEAEVWAQVINDLTDAAEFLPNADEVEQDGRIAKGPAYHLLAEAYIVTKDYPKAIAAASEVIDNLGYSLMKERFGTRSGEPGDVYWDLFRRGNQNRSSGNTEAIWVSQYEYLTPGGGPNDNLARFLVTQYMNLKGNDNVSLFIGPTTQHGGRGIGWWAASDYMLNQVWQNDTNDIRNSQYNIMRDMIADNPSSAYYGQKIVESGSFSNFLDPLKRSWSAIFVKSTPINNFPVEAITDPVTGLVNTGSNHSYRDRYVIRLAETYLLRAEAYLLNDDPTNALIDLNTLRERSSADPISVADVTMDFILDERARELFVEENRLFTLMRMDKIVERVKAYNPMHNGVMSDNAINDYQNKWPIPSNEIERNTEATLEQNPGY
tara:strand:- start:5480 stop:7147 length:1668 start_codon:yes stop_codon:yes gene_type:complete